MMAAFTICSYWRDLGVMGVAETCYLATLRPGAGDSNPSHLYPNVPVYGTLRPSRRAGHAKPMKRVLIIEDDKDIVELVRYNLANEGFQVNAAFDGSSGLIA